MKKVSLVFRGRNSRRNFRGLNSETELVGKEVEVTEGNEVSQAEVAEVTVDKEGTTTLTLENGDEVELSKSEAEDLVETGQAVAEDEPKKEPEEFEVTRDVKDADGNETEVTTTVAAESEGDAVKTVETLDSRRGRNARCYRVNSRRINSGPGEDDLDRMQRLKETPDSKWTDADRRWMMDNWGISKSNVNSQTDPVDEPKEFKVVRKVDCDGKKFRKIASVTAPTVEEAIEAVQAKDNADNIKAEGYAELVDEEPKSMVTINSDVEEVLDEPKPAEEPVKEMPESPEAPVEELKPAEEPTKEETPESPEAPVEEPKKDEDDEIDRTSNSYKGVSDFVSRRYGIKI